MPKLGLSALSVLLLSAALARTAVAFPGSAAVADQAPPTTLPSDTRLPAEVEDNFLQASGVHAHFEASNKMSEPAGAVLARDGIVSVPHFTSSFAFQGKTYPFTVVGHKPQIGVSTRIGTQIVPLSFYFEGYTDEQGNPIVLDMTDRVPAVLNSPNFRNASYPNGITQFGDAVQRAEFFRVMSPDWHTLLESPRVLRTINIDVPRGMATVYRMRSSGAIFAVVDEGFLISQLNTIIQLEELDVASLPIVLSPNIFLAPAGDIRRCCVMGFHTSFDAGQSESQRLVQTLVWASWIDSGIFGGTVGDVTAMSHEISEWLNDPFSTNIVPEWQFPNGIAGCQNNLETGDPMSAFAHAGFPVIIDGFTYHPQNEALLQWFQRKTPSDAVDGAYSFPDETLLTSPAQACSPR